MGKVRYNQTGYVGCSMSERAVAAYESGEKPKSKWTKAAMLGAIERYCDEQGLAYDPEGTFVNPYGEVGFPSLKTMPKDDVFRVFFTRTSWHHTGKYANETPFYGVDEDAVWAVFGGNA